MIFSLFGGRKQHKAGQLNRDAPMIIEQAENMFTANSLSQIAVTVTVELKRAHDIFGRKPIDLQRAHYEYRKLHKEARRRNNQADLTAMTLVIIQLQAEIIGMEALQARTIIDQFIERYS